MNEERTLSSTMRRFAIPLLVAVVLVIGTVLISGSNLIRIEDITVNRILAGAYGTPDWRVQEMNPLLAQPLTLLYRVLPAVNWYGVMLLALLLISVAAGISLSARKPGGLIIAVIIAGPILVLLTDSVISTTICALCASVGVFSLMDGIQRRREGIPRAVLGGVLFAFGAMLSLQWAIILGICAAVCWLPCSVRDSRMRGFWIGLPVLAVIALALFGYSALMYNSPELSAYRENYARYERLQHSSLHAESDVLLEEYGFVMVSDDHADHDHDGDGVADGADHYDEDDVITPESSFDAVGWTVNDSSLFFTRYGSDSALTDPEALKVLEAEASFWDFTPGRLLSELWTTIKKPQFLLLIALFVASALVLMITSRRRGLVVLLAAIIAFGGHILMLARYYDTFAEIAPFYLLAIVVMLYFFDGSDLVSWRKRVLPATWLRAGLSVLVLLVFVAGMGGMLYYTRVTPANANIYTLNAIDFLKSYITEHPDMLFIGDNPNERYKPETFEAPVRGEDQNLLAGSYDLYSPRAAALMEQYGIDNPLPDSVGRDDIGYVLMGFQEPVTFRMLEGYQTLLDPATELVSYPDYSEMIVLLTATYSGESLDEHIETTQQQLEVLNTLNELAAQAEGDDHSDHDHEAEGDDHVHEDDHEHEEGELQASESSTAPVASASPTAAASPTATAAPETTATATATMAAEATASPGAAGGND